MTYYVAEIRFNRTNRNSKRDRRMRKRLTLRLITLILVSLLFSASIMIISAAACQNKPVCCFCGDDDHEDDYDYCDDDGWRCKPRWWRCRPRELVISSLKRLRCAVSRLPKKAFKDPENAEEQKEALRNMICTVIESIKARKYQDALDMLEEIENRIREWIRHCWQTYLIKKVKYIIWLIEWILCRDRKPPTIVTVLRCPKTPNYDEPVTVIAQVIDKQSGVKSVILSYQVDSSGWINTTMSIIDGLYIAEIPPLPYDSAVNYKIYAYDRACNLAISETYSYMVVDFYPPVISYVDRIPASPNYKENVTVFANVTEPPEASGVKNVTLRYKTNGEWQPVEMILDQLYIGIIPAFPYETVVQYKIRAFDYADNWAASGVYSYMVGAPPPKLPPVAVFTESAETVLTGVVIHFDASGSYDPDGYIVSYFWTFGDGTNATGVTADHAYADDGKYTVTLTVTDNDDAVDFASSTKTVLSPLPPNQPPVAVFTESATTVFTNDIIKFNASASYDLDGKIVSYSWDFGDGNGATGVFVEHAYAYDGAYTVTLTVTDDDDATDTATSTKYVWNRPPVASFTESAEIVSTGEVISFNASESYDPDGVIDSYFWNFGDGTNATGLTASHAYSDDRTYAVTLTATDDDGASATATSTKTILNRPPVANFTESAETVDTGEVIRFNASNSYDPDGYTVSYFWDFGDGTNATGMIVTHAYADDGNYTVTLTVMDDDESSSSVSATKTVEAVAAGWPLALLAAIGFGIAALTATMLYALYRRRKRGRSAANPGNKPKPIVTLYVPAKILSRFELKPLKRRKD